MKINLSTLTYDLDGFVDIQTDDNSAMPAQARRVTATNLLDGGVAITDRGYSDGGRIMSFDWGAGSESEVQKLSNIFQFYQRVNLTTPEGVFLAALDDYEPKPDSTRMRLIAIEKVSI